MKTVTLIASVLTLAPFALGGCQNNQDDVSAVRAQLEQSQRQTADLQRQVAALNDRVGRLEAHPIPAKTEPPKPPPSSGDSDIAAIKRAIAACVQKVHSLETTPESQAASGRPYAEFDAFYNPGSNRVENNNRYVDQGPNYAFNKCMASKGVPLTN